MANDVESLAILYLAFMQALAVSILKFWLI